MTMKFALSSMSSLKRIIECLPRGADNVDSTLWKTDPLKRERIAFEKSKPCSTNPSAPPGLQTEQLMDMRCRSQQRKMVAA